MRYLILLLLLWGQQSQAQKEKQLHNQYLFLDGIYKNVEEFRDNKPTYSFVKLSRFNHDLDKDNNLLEVPFNTIDRFGKEGLDLRAVWGLCINKIPYKKLDELSGEKSVVFVKLHVIGHICYYYYNKTENEPVVMEIFDPLSGQKMAQKTIYNKRKTFQQKMFTFAAPNPVDFNREQLGSYIKDDQQLYSSFVQDSSRSDNDFLFKTLLIYNDRHPVLMK